MWQEQNSHEKKKEKIMYCNLSLRQWGKIGRHAEQETFVKESNKAEGDNGQKEWWLDTFYSAPSYQL
jgi:hypothetical protein